MRRSIYSLAFLLVLQACSASRSAGVARVQAASAPPPPSYPSYGPTSVPGSAGAATGAVYGGAPAPASGDYDKSVAKEESVSEVVTVSTSDTSGGGSAPTPAAAAPSAVEPQPNAQEMFDIEARISIEVEKVGDAAAKVREIVKKHGGQVVSDTVNDQSGSSAASFTMRVPSRGSEKFLDEIGGIGIVRNRQVTARDIGKEFHDAQIYLNNLMVTLKRYEEILAKAHDVNSILQIEREMTRIRGEIDRVKGDLRFMKDRAARATIYLTLFTQQADTTPTFDPKAKVYPGARALHFADFRGSKGDYGFLGFGLSIAASRYFSVDVDGMRRMSSPGQGLDAFFVTIGGEFYSDFLGAGRRTFMNPYIGWRLGYARIATDGSAKDEMLVGGTLGFELYKTKFFRFDAQTRLMGLFGNKDVGGHFGVQSGLQVHVAF
ncbi:MAG: DUF4349 domain-containing protein [Deltaproteobacteria bacterium]|nr:DUF4349 domain-containing protein [Deltaproteobacteria bacterium]